MRSIPSRPRTVVSAAAAVTLAAVLAACGGGSSTSAAAKTSSSTAAPTTGRTGGSAPGTRRGFPGVVGSVAAINGSSMEVQNPSSGQTTVNWTASTTFAQTVTLTASSVTAGDCVTVVGASSGGRITARSVAVSTAPASGTCAPGAGARGFGAGARNGTGPNRTGPNGTTSRRSFPAGGAARFAGSFASGKVVSSSATSLVILGTSFSGGRQPGSTPPTTAAPADITVTVQGSTVFTQVRSAAATSLAVGDCVAANGPADSTGAVTARSVRITSTGGKSCTTGFARFGGGAASSSASTNG